MIDMSQNRVPYGLLTDEEKAALHEHLRAGGTFEYYGQGHACWMRIKPVWQSVYVYRTVPLPLTQDEIAWDRLPDWVEAVATDGDGLAHCYEHGDCFVEGGQWVTNGGDFRRIDDFPGIVIKRGTCDWRDSKQRRPR